MATPSPQLGPPGADIPEMRHGVYIEKEGYLSRRKDWRNLQLRKKQRYLVVRGSNLKCFERCDDVSPEWELALQNAHVIPHQDRLGIEIRRYESSEEFCAETLEQFYDWFHALRYASERSIKEYYAFVKALGEGHFGKVLLAKDRLSMEKFAVKVIRKSSTEDRSETRIQRELDILRLVNHPNIVRLYDLFDEKEKLYFVLEYMAGGALYEVLSSEEMLYSEERASCIIKDVLHGLVYLHEKGIVHRDVKPQNILTTGRTWPFTSKLADFGLSNFLDSTTGLRSRVGTPYFCAREVATAETYGSKADLWSVGVVVYEMLSGCKPFEGTGANSVLHAIRDGRYSFPPSHWSTISTDARDFISRLICIDVDRRLSATQALQHPWIVNEGRHDPIPNSIPEIVKPCLPENAHSDEDMEEDA